MTGFRNTPVRPAPPPTATTAGTTAGTTPVPAPRAPDQPQTADPAQQSQQAQQATGWEIIRLRMLRGLTRDQLAASTGLTVGMIRRWEGGGLTLVNLHHLRAIAAALGTTAGALIDAGSTGTRPTASAASADPGEGGAAAGVSLGVRSPFVLLPTWLPDSRRAVTAWRLIQYVPRDVGQRWERAQDADPERTVSPPVLDWVSHLLRRRAALFGSATELVGQRSWYVGSPHTPTTGSTGSPSKEGEGS